jgi:peptidyl-prolyl cis-trans isomerase C
MTLSMVLIKMGIMETLRARHILVNHEYEAKDLLRKIEEGKSFEDLAKDYSICPSAKLGGNLGEFPKGRMVKIFEQALLKLSPGEISPPVKTQFGFHLIQRL